MLQGLQSYKMEILTFKDIKVERVAKLKMNILMFKNIKVRRVAKLQNPTFNL